MKPFLLKETAPSLEQISSTANFALSVWNEHKKMRLDDGVQLKSRYRNLSHVAPTSNIIERLFSRAGLVLTDLRNRTSPHYFECVMLLFVNSSMWNVKTIVEANQMLQEESEQQDLDDGDLNVYENDD